MTRRQRKKIIFFCLFLFIVILIPSSFYLLKNIFKAKNNLPEFLPIVVYPVEIVKYDSYIDLLGLVENPNFNLSLKKIEYQFLFFDKENNLRFKSQVKNTFIPSLSKRYLVETNFPKPEFDIGKVELYVNYDPKDFYKKSFDNLPFSYYNIDPSSYRKNNSITLDIFNSSYSEYKDVELILILFKDDEIVSVGKTIFSIQGQESKTVFVFFPPNLPSFNGYQIYFQRNVEEP